MMRIKQFVLKKIIKYPNLFNFLKKFRKIIHPRIYSCSISYENAVFLTKKLAKEIPNNFDVIVGIPRSGLFIADILATKFGRPLSTPDLFCKNEIWESSVVKSPNEIKRILLVDDSVNSGGSFEKAIKKIRNFYPGVEIKTAALVSTPLSKRKANYVFLTKRPKHLFEWQIIQGFKLTKLSVDMDGVLCEDCPAGMSLLEDEYIKWMKAAKPFLIPKNKIDTIITSRLEKYRDITEKWLRENNVKYCNLEMMDSNSEYIKTFENVVDFKIKTLLESKSDIFWESDFKQAEKINKITKIPIICIDEMVLFQNGK